MHITNNLDDGENSIASSSKDLEDNISLPQEEFNPPIQLQIIDQDTIEQPPNTDQLTDAEKKKLVKKQNQAKKL